MNSKVVKPDNKFYWWLLFRNPETNTNLGVVIIATEHELSNVEEAALTAHSLNVNPGGEILGVKISKETRNVQELEDNILYSKKQLLEMGYMSGI